MRREENAQPVGLKVNQEGEEMKKLDGRTKAGKATKLTKNQKTVATMVDTTMKFVEKVTDMDTVLAERGSRYGNFADHAEITQGLKIEMRSAPKWYALSVDQTEALEMIAHKIGRILNGDPNYADSWVDIAGYAKLVADRLKKEQK